MIDKPIYFARRDQIIASAAFSFLIILFAITAAVIRLNSDDSTIVRQYDPATGLTTETVTRF